MIIHIEGYFIGAFAHWLISMSALVAHAHSLHTFCIHPQIFTFEERYIHFAETLIEIEPKHLRITDAIGILLKKYGLSEYTIEPGTKNIID